MNQQLNLTDTLERSTALVPIAKDPTGAERQKRFRTNRRKELEAEVLQLAKRLDQPKPASDEFDWSDSGAVIIPEHQAVAVYEGARGDVIIRQNGGMYDEGDHIVIIHRDNLQAVIDRLCDLAGIGGAP